MISIASVIAFAGLAASAATPAERFIFSFGDSYTTTGFNISGTKPSTSDPLGNPAFPGATTSGGANYIGFLANGIAPANTLFYNFAVGGATVNNSIAGAGYIPDFVYQAGEFLANQPSGWTAANSAFISYFGTNDIDFTYQQQTLMAVPDLLLSMKTNNEAIIGSYFNILNSLYQAGARDFLLVEMDPLQRVPYYATLPNSINAPIVQNDVKNWNGLLSSGATSFRNSHAGATVQILDSQTIFNNILNNPMKYGSPDAVCYNMDGTSCLWWNNLHPGQAIHKGLAQGVFSSLQKSGLF